MVNTFSKEDDMSNLPDEIPVDEYVRGYDPEYDDESTDSAFTLASTTYDFSYEHGRRYQSYRYGSHPFPYDEQSVRNDRIMHHMYLFLFDNRLFVSPIHNPENILDVKCGQGLWAENMADAFPDTNIVAMDTTPMTRSTYPNLSYVVQSFTDEWVLDVPDMKFDFIFARNCFAQSVEFDDLYQQAFE